ncbi:MAG: nitroreductase family protein [Bacteroidales bacterium]|nr:nitroreductase family protein [Bacteroidales bacterium]
MIKDLVKFNRSYRRFYQDEAINIETLTELIDLARLSPSAKNIQAHKFIISNNAQRNAEIFETLAWAGYLPDWKGPVESERPAAYIIILGDRTISSNFDNDYMYTNSGIISQSILLGAAEKGVGGCIFASIQRKRLAEIYNLPQEFEIMLVIALGKPKEIVIIDELNEVKSIKYWRDKDQVHHVPKRNLEDLILYK